MPADHALSISSQSDVIHARMQVRESARRVGMQIDDQARISLATSSLANALGMGSAMNGMIDIARLENGKKVGLRVACVFKNNVDGEWVAELARSVRWMLDSIDIQPLMGDYIEIAMTKWVT